MRTLVESLKRLYKSEKINQDKILELFLNDKIYPVENGFFTVEPAEPVVPVYVPTQLDRIEAAVLQSKQDIIDEYTLELLESGAL